MTATIHDLRVRKPNRRPSACPPPPHSSLVTALATWLTDSGHPEDAAALHPYLPPALGTQMDAALARMESAGIAAVLEASRP